jgi:hypothetical protein
MPARVTWTPAMDATIRLLRADGFAWAEIARTLGLNPPTVRHRAAALGIQPGRYLSSGTLSGVAIVAGARPETRRFTRPSTVARLGSMWQPALGSKGRQCLAA